MRIRKQVTTGVLLLVFLIALNISVNAERGSITVKYAVQNHTVPISGATFSIVKLIEFRNGVPVLCNEALKNNVTEEDIYQNANDVAKKIGTNLKTKDGKTTGSGGEVCFTELEEGAYLIAQTEKRGSAGGYQMAVPTIVRVPEEEQGIPKYNIVIFPKTAPSTNSEGYSGAGGVPIKTGDETTIWKWILLMISTALMTAVIYLGGRRNLQDGKS